jgi:hypothetical protein
LLQPVVFSQCRFREEEHTQEEIACTIVSENLHIRRTERHSERLVDTPLEGEQFICFAIDMDTERTTTVGAAPALSALDGPLQSSHRRGAEKTRGKTVICDQMREGVIFWDAIVERVIQRHVTPSRVRIDKVTDSPSWLSAVYPQL